MRVRRLGEDSSNITYDYKNFSKENNFLIKFQNFCRKHFLVSLYKDEKYSHKEESGFEFTSETNLVLHRAHNVVWHGKLNTIMGIGKPYWGARIHNTNIGWDWAIRAFFVMVRRSFSTALTDTLWMDHIQKLRTHHPWWSVQEASDPPFNHSKTFL